MGLLCGVATERRVGPELAITCPKCKRMDMMAGSYELVETMKLFWVLPILRHRNMVVVCSGCGSKLYSKLRFNQMLEATPEQVDRSLYPEGGMLVVTLFLISLMILLCPVINLIPAIFVPIVNRHASRANRIAGYIPIVLALLYNAWYIWAFVMNGSGKSP